MRSYRHKPNTKLLTEIRQERKERYAANLAFQPRDERAARQAYGRGMAAAALSVAALEHAFEAPVSEVRSLLCAGADFAAMAVESGYRPDPDRYMQYLALAVVCGRTELRRRLDGLSREGFTNPNVGADEVFYLAAEAMAHLSAGRRGDAARVVESGLERVAGTDVPAPAREAMEPLLRLQKAVLAGDPDGAAAAVEARTAQRAKGYSVGDLRNEPDALLDVVGLGMLALAREAGVRAAGDGAYLPLDLLPQPGG